MKNKCCIVCGSTTRGTWAVKNGYTAFFCKKCSFVYIDPIPDQSIIDDFYCNYIGNREKMIEKKEQRGIQYEIDKNFILNLFDKRDKINVLDVGCADGSFLSTFDDRFIKFGIEKDHFAVELAKKQKFGKNILCGDLQTVQLQNTLYDLVIMRGVIEHLADPNGYISKIRDILAYNGYLYICATPNIDSFCAYIFKEQWNQFIPPEHLLYFSDKTLERYLSKWKFKKIKKHFPYTDTPYADPEKDYESMMNACVNKSIGKKNKNSLAFWGNMMNIVFKIDDGV